MTSILVLRPSPGAEETVARAAEMGLDAAAAPLFAIRPVPWDAPAPADMDAVMLTSANAPRCAGPALKAFLRLPCFAVGDATAAEARRQGFEDVRTGGSDAAALAELMVRNGIGRALHLCGREHIPLDSSGLSIVRRIVYAADPIDRLPDAAAQALADGAIALIHSPRAADVFAQLVEAAGFDRTAIRLAAISATAADAAGGGWQNKAIATAPRDDALLELAAKLCKTDRMGTHG